VEDSDQIMLVSNAGQLIRVPVDNIRFASRASKGVRIFRTADEESVVSVERISETDEDDDDVEEAEVAEASVSESGDEAAASNDSGREE
jgi:DNA gyrase subunit A